MRFFSKIIITLAIIALFTGCVTTGTKPGTENQGAKTDKEMFAVDALYAAVKLLPAYIEQLPDIRIDAYIKNNESSIFNQFKAPRNEFEKSELKERRKQVREKIKQKAQAFNLNTEYQYVYRGGVTLGEYDFDSKSFPIKALGNFYLSFTGLQFPDSVYIQYPKTFNSALPIGEKEGKRLVERSYARDRSQHRKVFPVITFKLVDAKHKDTERLKAAEASYQGKVDRIVDMDRMMNKALNAGDLPGQGSSKHNLKKAENQRKLRKLEAGASLRAVVTGITIYRRPDNIWVNTTLVDKRF